MFLALITLPDNFIASTTAYVGMVFSDLGGLIALIIGVLLGLVVVEVILGIFRHK